MNEAVLERSLLSLKGLFYWVDLLSLPAGVCCLWCNTTWTAESLTIECIPKPAVVSPAKGWQKGSFCFVQHISVNSWNSICFFSRLNPGFLKRHGECSCQVLHFYNSNVAVMLQQMPIVRVLLGSICEMKYIIWILESFLLPQEFKIWDLSYFNLIRMKYLEYLQSYCIRNMYTGRRAMQG